MVRKSKHDDVVGMDKNDLPSESLSGSFFGDALSEEPVAELPALTDSNPSAIDAKPAGENTPYLVLARKYRPQTFDQIVGQDDINQALRGAIAGGKIANAYLFSGPRGTGKTSTARILAKSLNCKTGPRPDPCGKCESCRTITAGSSLDVIEIDAASNTGVDNIRDLRTGVVLAPFSRYKVYIVDEVHMLSTAAFNALLKTLEEPPRQVVFVLATTELQKVPETIISRCQSYAFRRFSISEIISQLDKIFTLELASRGIIVEDSDRFQILELIARHAEGGMRDAQVALDQVLVLAGKKLDFETVRRFLGSVQTEVLDRFISFIYERRTTQLLVIIEELSSSGQDLELFAKSLAEQVRDLLIVRTAPAKPELLTVSTDRYGTMRILAEKLPISFLLSFSAAVLSLVEEMKTSQQQRFLLEFLVIRLTQVNPVDDIEKIVTRLQELEKLLSAAPANASVRLTSSAPHPAKADNIKSSPVRDAEVSPASYQASPEPTAMIREEEEESSLGVIQTLVPLSVMERVSVTDISSDPADTMSRLREATAANNSALYRTLLDATILSFKGDTLTLGVDKSDKFGFAHLDKQKNQQILKDIAREITGRSIAIKVQFAELKQTATSTPASETGPASHLIRGAASLSSEKHLQESSSMTGSAATELKEEPDLGVGPERRERTVLKGEALRQFTEKHADLKELIAKVKETFQVDDSQLAFRRRTT